jgi:DNA-3-methyladenine glycosylase I
MSDLPDGLTDAPDGRPRCPWHGGTPDYVRYHDTEWGRPVGDGQKLFEKICLEGFQAGLAWITILRKRAAFRAAFHDFDVERVAGMGAADVERLLGDAGIVRHRAKILSTINNARQVRAMRERGEDLAKLVWSFEPEAATRPARIDRAYLGANTTTPASTALSAALKARGFSFVGPTTVYAFMQSMGLVNDHLDGCHCRPDCEADRAAFVRPR